MEQSERGLFALKGFFVRNGEFFPSLTATAGQHPSAVGGSHSLTETVFILALAFGGLVCTLHSSSKLRAAKVNRIFVNCKKQSKSNQKRPFWPVSGGNQVR